MNAFDPQRRQDKTFKKRSLSSPSPSPSRLLLSNATPKPPSSLPLMANYSRSFPCLDDDDLVSAVVPPVTVVLEGRSICHRISLHKHASYNSLAMALRQMFVDGTGGDMAAEIADNLDLTNAVPGHLVAYEDMENDLLLAGDLNWKDFVRVAKRIRILPVKGNPRKR
ncbi:hypothetical protein JCGZ_08665 [Jatropha curcas]|uniref:Auxin-responsive protein n=1 Tax=Jatropha curcas TaxID=180498 RepID=A0A067KJI4_JATCU|nr:auxin-responsive protein IAA33 [Jatropha curcas]KDP36396.1 hypothetical protein JCGZ_08665 [Jatropha curcas]